MKFYRIDPHQNLAETQQIWQQLAERVPHSFFLSWYWMEAWLKSLPAKQKPELIYGIYQGKTVIAYFLCHSPANIFNRLFFRSAHLNSTGDETTDLLTIEYNGILFDRANAPQDLSGLAEKSISPWNQLVCPAVEIGHLEHIFCKTPQFHITFKRTKPCYFVDLSQVRENSNDLAPLLSRNCRYQIRQSIKAYSSEKPIELHRAQSTQEALAYLDELAILHQKTWHKRGGSGAFSEFFRKFHRHLIAEYFDQGITDLLKISVGDEVLGYLYNFVYQGEIFFYQCGFNYRQENRFRPGLVSHYLAINDYATRNLECYEFLEGDETYKQSLATNHRQMVWALLRKNKLRFRIEKLVRSNKRPLPI